MRNSRQRQGGFTLLEMMIALGVGAVLTYLMVTMLKDTGKQAASITAKNDHMQLVNEMQQVFNNTERCLAAFKAPNTVVPSLNGLGAPGITTTPVPVAINFGNGKVAPYDPPYTAGAKWGSALTISTFSVLGRVPQGDPAKTDKWSISIQVVASRRVGGDRAGSETAAGGDFVQKTFNLMVTLDSNGRVVGCSGKNRTLWESVAGPIGSIIYRGGSVGMYDSDHIQDPDPTKHKLEVLGRVNAVNFEYNSDARLKENVRSIPRALERVMSLHGVMFDWADRTSGEDQLGFVAQEVEQVFPEAVDTNTQTGLKSVAYENLLGPLVEAMKERQETLRRQQRELAEIRKAVSSTP